MKGELRGKKDLDYEENLLVMQGRIQCPTTSVCVNHCCSVVTRRCQIKAVQSSALSYCSISYPLKVWYCTLESCRSGAQVLLLQCTYFVLHPSQIFCIKSAYLAQKDHPNVSGNCGSSTELEVAVFLPFCSVLACGVGNGRRERVMLVLGICCSNHQPVLL